jgi:hypothetical protein
MAPSGSDWGNNPTWAAQAIVNNNERELLRRIWLEADIKPTAFVSIDTEYTTQGVCELGFATRQKHGPIAARHLIVDGNRGLKQSNPKIFTFGSSREVQHVADLRPVLVDLLSRLQAEHEVVVLTGHDIQVELRNLKKCCGWEVPDEIIILDTLHIWRSWINVPHRGNLAQALGFFAIQHSPAELHNAGNDAGYTLELLICKAIQAVECPVRLSKTDHEEPITPGSGKKAARKRKREAQRALDQQGSKSSRRAPSPETPLELERSRRTKRRKIVNSGHGSSTARSRQLPAGCAELIDLTDDTPPPYEPAGSSHEPIDLTDDAPSPRESAGQIQDTLADR